MAEKITDKDITAIRKLIKEKSAIIGMDETLKNLKLGKINKVYLSSNCSKEMVDKIDHYSKLSKIQVTRLKYPNDELGMLCKKPFSISILSVPK